MAKLLKIKNNKYKEVKKCNYRLAKNKLNSWNLKWWINAKIQRDKIKNIDFN